MCLFVERPGLQSIEHVSHVSNNDQILPLENSLFISQKILLRLFIWKIWLLTASFAPTCFKYVSKTCWPEMRFYIMWRNLLAKYGNRVKTNELDDRISFILDARPVGHSKEQSGCESFVLFLFHSFIF